MLARAFSQATSAYALRTLTPAQLAVFNRDGFILLKNFLPAAFAGNLDKWATELELAPEIPGKMMKYFEYDSNVGTNKLLSRVENILPFHSGLKSLVDQVVTPAVSDCFGHNATIYKEKINFKFPKGKGFTAHQDQPAYTSFGIKRLITTMVPVDDNTPLSGGLEFAYNRHERVILEQNLDGGIRTDLEAKYNFLPIDAHLGDMIIFCSYSPHRSHTNRSSNPRRNLYFTYNSLQDGDYRERYYEKRRRDYPPESERDPNKDYSEGAKVFNVSNPFK
jgi:hypothetical protein